MTVLCMILKSFTSCDWFDVVCVFVVECECAFGFSVGCNVFFYVYVLSVCFFRSLQNLVFSDIISFCFC